MIDDEEETDSYVIKQYHRLSVEHLFSLAGLVSTFVSTQQVGIRSNQIKRIGWKTKWPVMTPTTPRCVNDEEKNQNDYGMRSFHLAVIITESLEMRWDAMRVFSKSSSLAVSHRLRSRHTDGRSHPLMVDVHNWLARPHHVLSTASSPSSSLDR